MKPVQTRILDHGGDTLYAAGFDGVWLTLTVGPERQGRSDVLLHAPFPIIEADCGEDVMIDFIAHGEPDHDCRLLPGCCWMVQHFGAHASAAVIPRTGKPGEAWFDTVVLQRLSREIRDASQEVERPTWRARVARLVRKWALR